MAERKPKKKATASKVTSRKKTTRRKTTKRKSTKKNNQFQRIKQAFFEKLGMSI